MASGQETKEKLNKEFTIIDSKQNLYTVNDRYVLQPIFCEKGGELSEIRVVPKHFFIETHSKWTEPDSPVFMQLSTYGELLRRIERVKSVGALKQSGKVGIALNLRTSFWDQYDGGVVERAMFRSSPEEPDGIAWFVVIYFRLISGTVESKKVLQPPAPDLQYRVKVDGTWYWTSKSVFEQSTVGASVRVMGAGPIRD